MLDGWITLHRKIKDHWLWQDPVKFQWWLDILLTVNHVDKKVNIGNMLIDSKRGQTVVSLQTWATRWKTNKSMVRRFFYLLEKDNMIVTENVKKTTRITVCKYDSYQSLRNDNETKKKRKRNDDETQLNPNNNDNNGNNEKEEIYISPVDLQLMELPSEFGERWDKFNKWFADQEFEYVIKIEEQIMPKNLFKLLESYGATEIKNKLLYLENAKNKYTKNKSVYLTINNWLNRQYA